VSDDENPWYDGGDLLAALGRTQETLSNLTVLMKTLDDRLVLQEERVRWLKENNAPILRAFQQHEF
jgi:prophage antirepressor-like protein